MRGLGIDAVEIGRFRSLLERRPRLRERLFTPAELASLASRVDQAPSLAARFAVREATMKALGVGLGAFDFHDVEVASTERGEPRLVVRGRAAELAREAGVHDWKVSITHTDRVAMAIVAAL
ncbi:MAG: holo-ACP synthase [Actinomycetota bacterium]